MLIYKYIHVCIYMYMIMLLYINIFEGNELSYQRQGRERHPGNYQGRHQEKAY